MLRINLLLLLAVMTSAIFLVHTQYESRRLYTQLDRAHAQAKRLDAEHEQLVLEKRAQATSARVQHIAISQLNRLCNGFQLFLFQLVIQHFGFLSGLLYQRRLQCFLRIEIERTGCNQKDNSCGSSHILPFSS